MGGNPYPRHSGGLTTFAPLANPAPARVVSAGRAGVIEYGHAAAIDSVPVRLLSEAAKPRLFVTIRPSEVEEVAQHASTLCGHPLLDKSAAIALIERGELKILGVPVVVTDD